MSMDNSDEKMYNGVLKEEKSDKEMEEEEEEEEEETYHEIAEDNEKLPETVTVLTAENGVKVFLIGTAHFSLESQQDVIKTINCVKPNMVMVELCPSRASILSLNEELLLREAGKLNFQRISSAIKEEGLVQGVVQILLLNISAHITKQLGMAPGGEFRAAFKEAKKLPRCRVQLGDRPIGVTLQRAIGALSFFQKLQLAWCLITSKASISQEDVEKCKQKDILEEVLREMTGEFPELSKVFVEERDMFLTHSLKMAALLSMADFNASLENVDEDYTSDHIPAVVGVVGIGHCPGIVSMWNLEQDLSGLLTIPAPSYFGKLMKLCIKVSLYGVLGWGCYKTALFVYNLTTSH